MTMDLRSWLREGDPAWDRSGLSQADASRIRMAMLDEAARRGRAPAFEWDRALAVAAVVVLMLVTGIYGGQRLPESSGQRAAALGQGTGMPRQLQFATPGGTRIIWIFDPDFTLKESLP